MSKTHGMSHTRLYAIYKDMIRRCHNKKDKRKTKNDTDRYRNSYQAGPSDIQPKVHTDNIFQLPE